MRELETSTTPLPQLSSFEDVRVEENNRNFRHTKRASGLLSELLEVLTAAAEALETERDSQAVRETDFYEAVRNFEISLIQRALRSTGGNQAKAARLLHLKQTTLHGKIKKYKIHYAITVGHDSDDAESDVSS